MAFHNVLFNRFFCQKNSHFTEGELVPQRYPQLDVKTSLLQTNVFAEQFKKFELDDAVGMRGPFHALCR